MVGFASLDPRQLSRVGLFAIAWGRTKCGCWVVIGNAVHAPSIEETLLHPQQCVGVP